MFSYRSEIVNESLQSPGSAMTCIQGVSGMQVNPGEGHWMNDETWKQGPNCILQWERLAFFGEMSPRCQSANCQDLLRVLPQNPGGSAKPDATSHRTSDSAAGEA